MSLRQPPCVLEMMPFRVVPRVATILASGAYLGTVTGRALTPSWLGRDRVLLPIEDEATGVTTIGIFTISPTDGEGVTDT